MLIDVRKLLRSGKTQEKFFFEYNPNQELCTIPDTEILNPVAVNGEVFLTGQHSAYIEGEIFFKLKGNCTRCLKETEKGFTAEIQEEVSPDNPESYPMKNDVIDLTQIVEDKIVTTLPLNFLCKEDCKGICPDCGVNLNEEKCKCKNK